jgi:hypothetical protein
MHRELLLGDDGLVMIGQAGDSFKSPSRLEAYPSVLVHFYVDDVDALHERARAAGADVSDLRRHRRETGGSPQPTRRGRCGCSRSAFDDLALG